MRETKEYSNVIHIHLNLFLDLLLIFYFIHFIHYFHYFQLFFFFFLY